VFGFQGASPAVMADKPRSSFSSWSGYQKRTNPATTFESSMPWCKLLSQSGQVLEAFLLVNWVSFCRLED
jgi:hypothetical protein